MRIIFILPIYPSRQTWPCEKQRQKMFFHHKKVRITTSQWFYLKLITNCDEFQIMMRSQFVTASLKNEFIRLREFLSLKGHTSFSKICFHEDSNDYPCHPDLNLFIQSKILPCFYRCNFCICRNE